MSTANPNKLKVKDIMTVVLLALINVVIFFASSTSHEAAERFGSISFMVNSFRLHYAARCFFTMPLPIAAPMNAATITPATSATDTQDCSISDAARMVS